MYLNIFIIEDHCASGRVRDIATFIFLKNKFQNSCIYRYNPFRSGKSLGLSRNTIKKYVDRFLAYGWCEMRGRDLFFHHVNKTANVDSRHTENINLEGNINEIIQKLRLLVLSEKQKRFEWAAKRERRDRDISVEDFINETYDLTPMQLIIRNLSKRKLDLYENCHFFMSFKTIGKALGCCAAQATKIIKGLCKTGIIKVFKKELGFLKKRRIFFTRTPEDYKGKVNEVFEGRPSKQNWCDFKKYCFPNSYDFNFSL